MSDTPPQTKQQHKKLWPLIALNICLFALVSALAVYTFKAQPQLKTSNENISGTIPAFGMESLGGKNFGRDDLKAPVMIINIFASWCPPCLAEHPYLLDMKNTHNMVIYGIALKDTKENIQSYLKKHENPYKEVGMDYAGLLPNALKLRGVPSTLIITEDYKIHKIIERPLTAPIIQKEILPMVTKLQTTP